MRLNNLRLKLRRMSLKRFLVRNVKRKSRKLENGKRSAWMNPVSHGYRVVKLDQTWAIPISLKEFDPIVVQREQTKDCELCFFGVFDDVRATEDVTKYMQTNFFNNLPDESNMVKKCKESMERAHLKERSQEFKDEAKCTSGSASAMVINGQKLIMASMGGYTAVVCRDGKAYQVCRKRQQPTTPKWPLHFIPGSLRMPRISSKSWISSEVAVESARIDSETEFVILASSGVWEVMRQQEAVNLISHIEDAQEAAECLANEALIRMTKSIISCLVIRFH